MGWQRVASCVLTRKPAPPEGVIFEAEGETLDAGRGSTLHAPIVLHPKKLLVNTNDYH